MGSRTLTYIEQIKSAEIIDCALYDDEYSVEEDRYIAIGLVEDILFVVHTMRNENVRMISARLATKQERRFYYDSQHSGL